MEVQLSMVRKTPIESSFCGMVCGSNLVPRSHSVFPWPWEIWVRVWVLTVHNRFDQNILGEMNLCT